MPWRGGHSAANRLKPDGARPKLSPRKRGDGRGCLQQGPGSSAKNKETSMQEPLNASYPVLPLRDIVVFPHMIVPLFVGREKSVRALEEVMQDDKQTMARQPRNLVVARADNLTLAIATIVFTVFALS